MRSKNFFLVIILFAAATSTCVGQLKSNKDLIGKWTASTLKLEFLPDGRVLFVMRGGTIPGAKYKTDFLKTPPLLEIELIDHGKKIVYRSTIEFISNTSIRLTSYKNDPVNAFDKQGSVILMKER